METMTFSQLPKAWQTDAKQAMLTDIWDFEGEGRGPSWGEMAGVDDLITDIDAALYFGDTKFVKDDFICE